MRAGIAGGSLGTFLGWPQGGDSYCGAFAGSGRNTAERSLIRTPERRSREIGRAAASGNAAGACCSAPRGSTFSKWAAAPAASRRSFCRRVRVTVDMSTAVEANQENLPQTDRHRIVQADAVRLPFAPRQYDIVFCLGVIQHTPVPEETIEKLYAHVKPGG